MVTRGCLTDPSVVM